MKHRKNKPKINGFSEGHARHIIRRIMLSKKIQSKTKYNRNKQKINKVEMEDLQIDGFWNEEGVTTILYYYPEDENSTDVEVDTEDILDFYMDNPIYEYIDDDYFDLIPFEDLTLVEQEEVLKKYLHERLFL